jgi:radical SAM protein with 4Fe4S-binding SPASM domain
VDDLPGIYQLLKSFGIARWSLFFLISVGRGKVLQPLSPEEGENLMSWIFETSRTAPFVVATTEAPSYRRVALEAMRAEGMTGEQIKETRAYRSFGIRDGHGIVFVSHMGEICPAGFLPLVVGNVRQDNLAEVYWNAPAFKSLHDPRQFEGRCGCCQYHMLCGGSRARAFEATGNILAADPFCTFEPRSSAV